MAGITNTQLMKAIHEMDVKLEKYIAYRKDDYKRLVELCEDVNGNGHEGIKFQSKTLWAERVEKKAIENNIKVAIIISVLSAITSVANIVF